MALVVEDGTGLPNAESLISVADAVTFLTSLGYPKFVGLASDTLREQKLRLATMFVCRGYRFRYSGRRTTTVQALDFPREGMPMRDGPAPVYLSPVDGVTYYPSNAVPIDAAHAVALAAELSAGGTDLQPNEPGRAVIEKEIVGVVRTKWSDTGGSAAETFTQVETLLAPFFNSSGNSVRIRRA